MRAIHSPSSGTDDRQGDAVLESLSMVPILALRLHLSTPGVEATVPMLRGVWGAALHEHHRATYDAVFEGHGAGQRKTPLYVIRPAPTDAEPRPAVEWILFGAAIEHFPELANGWRIACDRGLGPNRQPFAIDIVRLLRAEGPTAFLGAHDARSLADHSRFRDVGPADDGFTLVFDAPLRLIRNGRLIEAPTVADVVVAACRRLDALGPDTRRADQPFRDELLDAARMVVTEPWEGARLDLQRYSARQQREIEVFGVSGALRVRGLSADLLRLLSACEWMHIGKGTTIGLGSVRVER